MKKCLLLLLTVISLLLADNQMIDKGHNGYVAEIRWTKTNFSQRFSELTTGYTFKNGSSARTYLAYDIQNPIYIEIYYPSNRICYTKVGATYSHLLNEQTQNKFPVDIALAADWFYNVLYGESINGPLIGVETHMFLAGIDLSYDLNLFSKIDIIPVLSVRAGAQLDLSYPEIAASSWTEKAVLSGKLIVKYGFIYAVIQYDKEYNPYDSISLYSLYNIGWHAGLGVCFRPKGT